MESGIELIAAERKRQVEVEGWTLEHDIENDGEAMAFAAVCYALPGDARHMTYDDHSRPNGVPRNWPWDGHWWKPTPDDRVRELVKAGALIAAEIDRIQRSAA